MSNEEQMMYASVSIGYNSGGFRLGSVQPTASFGSEEVISYEIGFKSTYPGVLRINAALYFYDYTDMQVLVPYLNDVNFPVEEIINVDDIRSQRLRARIHMACHRCASTHAQLQLHR